jgi:hypothetical protein
MATEVAQSYDSALSSSNYLARADAGESTNSVVHLDQYLLGGMNSDKAHLETLTKTILK